MNDIQGPVPPGPVLVTGATGMLGSRLVELLSAAGWDVRALARNSADAHASSLVGAIVVSGDVTDSASLRAAVKGCTAVFHTAALVPESGIAEEDFHSVNVDGTRNVLEAAAEAGVQRVVHVSTINAIDGRPGVVANETTGPPRVPHTGYDASKVAGEEIALNSDLDVVVVNPAVIFGPRSRHSGRIIELFLRGRMPVVPIPGRRMSFAFVDDVARGAILAMQRGRVGERYILASPPITLGDFISDLAAVSGRKKPRISLPAWPVVTVVAALNLISGVTRWRPPVTVTGIRKGGALFDGNKARHDLGLEYTPMRDALATTVAWIRNQRDSPG